MFESLTPRKRIKLIMKLELKHLKGYLDCGLLGVSPSGNKFYLGVGSNMLGKGVETRSVETFLTDQFKPLLHPLSSLTKEIEHDGERFVPIKRINKDGDVFIECGVNHCGKWYLHFFYADSDYSISFSEFENIIEKLYKWHIDIHGLIERGLAISK